MLDIRYLQAKNLELEIILSQNSRLSYPLHNHTSIFTIGIILDGVINLTIDSQTANIYKKNQLFIIPPYLPHKIEAISNYSLLSICLDKQWIRKLSMTEFKLLLQSLFIKIGKAELLAEKKIIDLLDNLSWKNFSTANLTRKRYFDELKNQIEDTPELKYRIDNMAEKVFSSKYHFIKKFKKIVGLTPHQFQVQNRIRKAQKLLSKATTITEVALTTGFCDQSHFIKQFKKIVGLTPSDYLHACHCIEFDHRYKMNNI